MLNYIYNLLVGANLSTTRISRRTVLELNTLEEILAPAVFVVNTTADDAMSGVANLGNGTGFDQSLAKRVSLRSAIQEANFNVGADSIQFDLPVGSNISLNTALPEIISNIAIEDAAGAREITITRGAAAQFRLFTKTNDDIFLRLSHLTITNGYAPMGSDGGAVYQLQGELIIQNCHFTDNYADGDGGAVYSGDQGLITLSDSVFTYNSANLHGGALCLEYSDIPDNEGVVRGTITGSSFLWNSALTRDGGAIRSRMVLSVRDSIFLLNEATNDGGAIDTAKSMYMWDCDVSNNTSGRDGGGIFINHAGGSTSISNTTVRNNSATWIGRSLGGGIYVDGNNILLMNVTLTGNTSLGTVDGIAIRRGPNQIPWWWFGNGFVPGAHDEVANV